MKAAVAILLGALAAALAPVPAAAQTEGGADAGGARALFKRAPGYDPDAPSEVYLRTARAPRPESRSIAREAARLRMLDKMTGRVETFDLGVGAHERRARLDIALRACRTPPEDEVEDAFAYLEIRDLREDAPRFRGWMIASSPALSALDHARYDVWVLSCSTSDGAASSGSAQKSD